MKREAVNHTKMKRLCRRLSIPTYQGVGLLESIWHLTAREAPRGDIGKLSDEDIAIGIDYRGDEAELIEALVSSGWVDRDSACRLSIHDWAEHADDAVNLRLARAKEFFWNGSAPSFARIGGKEREKIVEFYSVRTPCAQKPDPCARNAIPCAPPEPRPSRTPPEPEPEPEPQPRNAPVSPTPIRPALPANAERRIRKLADSAPDPQDYEAGVSRAVQELISSMNPEVSMTAMEANIPAWWEAMRTSHARMKTFRWLITDGDYLRRPREPTATAQSNAEKERQRLIRTPNPRLQPNA